MRAQGLRIVKHLNHNLAVQMLFPESLPNLTKYRVRKCFRGEGYREKVIEVSLAKYDAYIKVRGYLILQFGDLTAISLKCQI